jgi:hypothetical protein
MKTTTETLDPADLLPEKRKELEEARARAIREYYRPMEEEMLARLVEKIKDWKVKLGIP